MGTVWHGVGTVWKRGRGATGRGQGVSATCRRAKNKYSPRKQMDASEVLFFVVLKKRGFESEDMGGMGGWGRLRGGV